MITGITGTIFNIRRLSPQDGPGTRTTVYFKGCPNRCGWCYSPEAFSPDIQIQFYPQRCSGCMRCLDTCPNGVHEFVDGQHKFYREDCKVCGACTMTCNASALAVTGRRVTVEDVMREIMDDAHNFEALGGGVTLSGGEPVMQHSFVLDLLMELKGKGIHTVLQTAGNYPFLLLKPLLPYIDIVMYDIKAMSEDIYDEHIHGDRGRMLENLLFLDDFSNVPIIVRTPLIEGVNANEAEIEAIAVFIKRLKHLESYRLLPCYRPGAEDCAVLGGGGESDRGGNQNYDKYSTPSATVVAALERIAAKHVPVFNPDIGIISPN